MMTLLSRNQISRQAWDGTMYRSKYKQSLQFKFTALLVDVQKSFYLLWLKAVGRLSSEAELKLFSKSNLLPGNEKNISV